MQSFLSLLSLSAFKNVIRSRYSFACRIILHHESFRTACCIKIAECSLAEAALFVSSFVAKAFEPQAVLKIVESSLAEAVL